MDALVWVEGWHLRSEGESFAVGQRVTWPISTQLNRTALVETVGPTTAAQVTLIGCFDPWHPTRPYETVTYAGTVDRIVRYRCRTARGHDVPGSVEEHLVAEADGWEPEDDGLHTSGYVVTLADAEALRAG